MSVGNIDHCRQAGRQTGRQAGKKGAQLSSAQLACFLCFFHTHWVGLEYSAAPILFTVIWFDLPAYNASSVATTRVSQVLMATLRAARVCVSVRCKFLDALHTATRP